MAWKNLKWDPAQERLDDFVYKLRRIAKELGYDEDEQLEVFKCCIPSHLYIYLQGATTLKEAMENIKRACALGGVSVQATIKPGLPYQVHYSISITTQVMHSLLHSSCTPYNNTLPPVHPVHLWTIKG